MDPIHPIAPGPPSISRAARLPVERLERIDRERDRPPQDRQPPRREPPVPWPKQNQDDDGTPHVDVRA